MRTEAVVIGAGLAGAALSTLLARQGKRVTLIEKSRGEHDKLCGEFYSAEACHYLAALDIDFLRLGAVPIATVRLASHSVIAECRLPFQAFSLPRRIVDESLIRQAEAAGVQVIRGTRVDSVTSGLQGWTTSLADGTSFASADAFVSTGKHNLRGHERATGIQGDLVAFKMYFALSPLQDATLGDSVELILFKGGYAGLQRVNGGTANLTLLIQRSVFRQCGGDWESVLAHARGTSRHLDERLKAAMGLFSKPLAISSIPFGFRRDAIEEKAPWYLGDQCAVIPSFTGDGMSIAFHSAFVAAEMYLQGATSARFQRHIASQLRRPMCIATGLSSTMIQMPALAGLLRVFPQSLSWIASQTRIPGHYMRTGGANLS